MDANFVSLLSAQSTLADLPAFDVSLDAAARGQALGELFQRHAQLPGVIVTEDDGVRGVLSRGQYLRLVGRYLGLEIYHPRPLRLMLEAIAASEESLILPAATPVQEAVGEALRRPRELLYEPVVMRGEGWVRLVDFQDLLVADSRISALRNLQMAEILATVQEGLLLVDRDHRIASERSRSVETILGRADLAARSLPEVVAEHVSEERGELCRGYLDTLFDPAVIERLVAQINPLLAVEARRADGRRFHLAFRFRRSIEGGVIRRLLVRIEDTTRAVELAQEAAEKERRARDRVAVVLEMARAEPAAFATFLADLDAATADGAPAYPAAVAALFRRVHGLKGEAGVLGLGGFATRLHRFEDVLAPLRDRPLDDDARRRVAGGLAELRELIDETRAFAGALGQVAGAAKPAGEVAAGNAGGNGHGPREAEGLFATLGRTVSEVAARLEKPARFWTDAPEGAVPDGYRPLLREVLVHLARNALVHGVEPAEERARRGKPAVATLQLALRRQPELGRLEVVFQDDGRGLDFERIRQRAFALGIAGDGEESLQQAIFAPGLSTAAETTLDAGRGVGLDLVRARVEEAGGAIAVHTEPGAWCAFQILLPEVDG